MEQKRKGMNTKEITTNTYSTLKEKWVVAKNRRERRKELFKNRGK